MLNNIFDLKPVILDPTIFVQSLYFYDKVYDLLHPHIANLREFFLHYIWILELKILNLLYIKLI